MASIEPPAPVSDRAGHSRRRLVIGRLRLTLIAGMFIAPGLVAACAAAAPASLAPPLPAFDVGIANDTTLELTLHVNGASIGIFEPGTVSTVLVRAAYPWIVEVKDPNGRVLTSMTIRDGDINPPAQPGGDQHSAVSSFVALPCGQVAIFGGDVKPVAPSPVPGGPATCS
jgi:hypothetical protein